MYVLNSIPRIFPPEFGIPTIESTCFHLILNLNYLKFLKLEFLIHNLSTLKIKGKKIGYLVVADNSMTF